MHGTITAIASQESGIGKTTICTKKILKMANGRNLSVVNSGKGSDLNEHEPRPAYPEQCQADCEERMCELRGRLLPAGRLSLPCG